MNLTVDNCQVVYFSGLTGSFKENESVLLKLTAKYGAAIFSVWVKPPQSSTVAPRFTAGDVECRNGELFVNKILKPSLPLRTALIMFHAFLKSARKPVVLVGYSVDSVSGTFLRKVQKTHLVDTFHKVIVGFTNAFKIWRNNRRDRTSIVRSRLSVLSRDFLSRQYSVTEYDIFLVSTLAQLGIATSTESQFIEKCESYEEAFTKLMNTADRFSVYKGLDRLLSHLPEVVARKMAETEFSYDSLERVFQRYGSEGLKKFLNPRLMEARLRVSGLKLSPAEINQTVANILGFFEQQNRRRSQVGSSSADQPRSTLSEQSRYQVVGGAGPVSQNPAEPTSLLHQIPSRANPVYQNFTEPTLFLDQVPSGADPGHENSPESLQRGQDILEKLYELHGSF